MAVSKVIYGNTTLIDLTNDTVVADKLLQGYTAHGKDGELVEGSSTFDSDTQDATATASDMLEGATAYVRGSKISGSIVNRGAMSGKITTKAQVVSPSAGYYDGSGGVSIDSVEQAKIIADNIKNGVEILGVTGTLSPASDVTSQAKTVTPYTTQQIILPDENFDYLSQVTVGAIAYVEVDNSAGGKTVTIGTVAPI